MIRYEDEIWNRMADEMLEAAGAQVFAVGRRIGWKGKRGEPKLPESLVRDLMRQAFKEGARAALKMVEALNGEDES